MRLTLIVLQVSIVAFIYACIMISAGGFSMSASGGGPTATAAVVFLVAQAAVLGSIFIMYVLPFSAVLIVSFFSALLAGYRFFRWSRWIGCIVNASAACFFIIGSVEEGGGSLLRCAAAAFFCLNCLLFYKIPVKPDVEKSRGIITRMHPVLLFASLSVFISLIAANARQVDTVPVQEIFQYIVFFVLYSIPFVLNFNVTRSVTTQGFQKKVFWVVSVSLLTAVLMARILPILAVPVGISLVLLIGFLEMLFLYPDQMPPAKSRQYFVAMVLGRLPDNVIQEEAGMEQRS